MDEDTEAAAWAQQELEEAQQLLRADPGFEQWLEMIEAQAFEVTT